MSNIVPPLKDYTIDGMQADEVKPRSRGKWRGLVHPNPYPNLPNDCIGLVEFAGQTFEAYLLHEEPALGAEVSVVIIGQYQWCMDADLGYPTRFPRLLGDFAETNPAGVFLRYIMKDNPTASVYQEAIYLWVSGNDTGIHRVQTASGETFDVTATWRGQTVIWPYLPYDPVSDTTPCLIYRATENAEWKMIAMDYYYYIGTGNPIDVSFYPTGNPDQWEATIYIFYALGPHFSSGATYSYSIIGNGTGYVTPSHSSPVALGSDPSGMTLTFSQGGNPGSQLEFIFRLTGSSAGCINPGFSPTRFLLGWS
jgi:hypothetical protein